MQNFKRRRNGRGTVVFLGNGRRKPYVARLFIGKDKDGKAIFYDLDTFENDIDALVCLENYIKNPTPLKIKQKKYDRIALRAFSDYPLVPVENMSANIFRKDKSSYTFRQLFEEMEVNLFPNKEELELERIYHIKPKEKFARSNACNMKTAYNQCQMLYDMIYKELRLSDFKSCINRVEVKPSIKVQMVKLFKHMDKYAYSEDIIVKKYTENLKAENIEHKTRVPFTYEELHLLWSINDTDNYVQFIRDFLLISIYTGCRAEELLLLYIKNIYLDDSYFITGLKTEAGKNRVIPIHSLIKPIIQKYYNSEKEFLFTSITKERMSYNSYIYHFRQFIDKYPTFEGKTAHCGRHTLETELQKMNIKSTIINSIIGHKNGNVADDVYNHISQDKITKVAFEGYFKKGVTVMSKKYKDT